jgi:DNA-binding transcriptional ArsR family regulator
MSRAQAHSDVFQAIADPTRRSILSLLVGGEQPVGQLAQAFDITLSAISQHMRVLREAGLVDVRHVGRERRYRLNPVPLQDVANWMAQYEPFWRTRLDALSRYLDEDNLDEDSVEEDSQEEINAKAGKLEEKKHEQEV